MSFTHVRTRNAPSPTGIPHIGNSRTALYDYLLAKKYGGQFILRIEDTDQDRFVEGSIEKIYEIHDFLGLVRDEDPVTGGKYGPYIQTQRLETYQKYTQELINIGAAYPCFCTTERLEKLHEVNKFAKYDRHCRNLSKEEVDQKIKEGTPYVVRAKMPEDGFTVWHDLVQGKLSLPNRECDDKILLKSSGIPTYHLAVVIDDHLMEISHVLRGVEWMMSTPVHVFLYQSLGWEMPILAHVPLLLGPDKSKLSKRHGAKSVLDYAADGYLSEALVNFIFYLGFSYQDNSKLLTLNEMVEIFDEKKLQKQNCIFDIQKLNYLNSQWIRKLSIDQLFDRLMPFMPEYMIENPEKTKSIISLVREKMYTLSEFKDLAVYFFEEPEVQSTQVAAQAPGKEDLLKSWFKKVTEVLAVAEDFSPSNLQVILGEVQKDSGLSPKEAYMSLRVALSGRTVTPHIFDCMTVLGKQLTLDRIKRIYK